jgi:hypothetical protein
MILGAIAAALGGKIQVKRHPRHDGYDVAAEEGPSPSA